MTDVYVNKRRSGKTRTALKKAPIKQPQNVLFISPYIKAVLKEAQKYAEETKVPYKINKNEYRLNNIFFIDSFNIKRIDNLKHTLKNVYIIYDELPFLCDFISIDGNVINPLSAQPCKANKKRTKKEIVLKNGSRIFFSYFFKRTGYD